MLNHLLTHSLNLMDIKRRSAPSNSSSPRSSRRPASRKPLSPRKQKRNARKKHGKGSALSTETPGDADRGNDPASATQSPNDADRMAKLLALKKQWDEDASPEAQAKKDAEKDTQSQKRCGVFFQGPSNVVSLWTVWLWCLWCNLSWKFSCIITFILFVVFITSQGKTLFMSLLVKPLQSALLNINSPSFFLGNVYFTTDVVTTDELEPTCGLRQADYKLLFGKFAFYLFHFNQWNTKSDTTLSCQIFVVHFIRFYHPLPVFHTPPPLYLMKKDFTPCSLSITWILHKPTPLSLAVLAYTYEEKKWAHYKRRRKHKVSFIFF